MQIRNQLRASPRHVARDHCTRKDLRKSSLKYTACYRESHRTCISGSLFLSTVQYWIPYGITVLHCMCCRHHSVYAPLQLPTSTIVVQYIAVTSVVQRKHCCSELPLLSWWRYNYYSYYCCTVVASDSATNQRRAHSVGVVEPT